MKRILVIGTGSLIMMDDGLGARVVDAIQGILREHDIAPFVVETDFQCCFDEIKSDDFLIMIDAMTQGKEPGSIEIMLLGDALKSRGKLCAQHEFSLFDLIELQYPEIQGYFIGIEAAEIGFGFELSKLLCQCFEQICAAVLATILNIICSAQSS